MKAFLPRIEAVGAEAGEGHVTRRAGVLDILHAFHNIPKSLILGAAILFILPFILPSFHISKKGWAAGLGRLPRDNGSYGHGRLAMEGRDLRKAD